LKITYYLNNKFLLLEPSPTQKFNNLFSHLPLVGLCSW